MRVLQPSERTNIRDWSDWVSPVLVKELRQGTRETSFVISFLFLQISLAFLAIVNLSGERVVQQNRYLFEGCLFGVFFFVLPLLSSFSLSQEVRQNTMETLLMTRLSAWGLVFGKWIARAFQSFLIAATVLPYFILQYLDGGEELLKDLELIIYLFFGNVVFLSIGVGISIISNGFIKFVSIVGSVFLAYLLTAEYYAYRDIQSDYGLLLGTMIYCSVIFIFIDLAASEIDASINNRPIYRRLYCLSLAIGFYLFDYLFNRQAHIATVVSAVQDAFIYVELELLLILLILFVFIEVSRTPVISMRIIRSYSSYGRFGKIMLFFCMPGWPSAFLFCLPAALMTFLFSFLSEHSIQSSAVFAFLGSILIPLICNTVGLTRFAISGFVLVGFNLFGFLVIGVPQPFSHSPYLEGILPFVPCFATLSSINNNVGTLVRASISCSMMICVLYVLAIPWLKKMDKAWREVCAEK